MDLQALVASALGVNVYHLIAGLAGGVVNALRVKQSIGASIRNAVIGTLTAAYLTPVVIHYLSLPPDISIGHATAFSLGLCAMWVTDGLVKLATKWSAEPTLKVKP